MSFIVIAFNEEAAIERTLESVLAQRHDHLEVIVVDDCSTDNTPRIVERISSRHEQLRLIRLPTNQGRGAARARGIAEASGAYIAMVDGDIVLPPDWLARSLDAIQQNDAVGGTASPDGDVAYLARRFGLKPKIVSHRTTVTGSNALYRRELFDMVGFDDSRRNGEDVAFNHAMTAADARLATVPGLVVEHNEHKSLRQSISWLFESGRGASRQLAEFRQIRLPDVAFLTWVAAFAPPALARGRTRRLLTCSPLAVTAAVAAGHVGSSFEIVGSRPAAVLKTTATDALLLTAYFCGRLIGIIDQASAAD